jgi:UDP-glucuronate 4-epimerase
MSYFKEVFCSLGCDNKEICNHCFPVLNCTFEHNFCKTNGICNEINQNNQTTILVTGCCGFIGFHLCRTLLENNYNIVGVDDFNSFIYDSKYKFANSKILKNYIHYKEYNVDLLENINIIKECNPDIIFHLAAYANIRKSIIYPNKFIRNNVELSTSILNEIKDFNKIPLFIYASSSSLYGRNEKIPFSEDDPINNIISPYALSKKCLEDMTSLFCNLYGIKAIGFRFFTVYGPGGRPDMAIFNFLKNIHNDKEIIVYGDGSMERDFTYVMDIVSGLEKSISLQTKMKEGENRIYNLGNNKPIKLSYLINACEDVVGKKAIIMKTAIPLGDVPITFANIDKATNDFGYNPQTNIYCGIKKMYEWMIDNNYLN